jgi:hypothetical protein
MGKKKAPNRRHKLARHGSPLKSLINPVRRRRENYDYDKPFVDSAFKLCDAFHRTGMVSKCDVIRSERAVDVMMRVNVTEGPAVVCQGSAYILRQHANVFRGSNWKLRIDGKECDLS